MMNAFYKQLPVRPLNVSIQAVRHKNTFSKKDRPAHFWAKKIKIVTKPILPKSYDEYFPSFYKCRKLLDQELLMMKKQTENPYERILANEIIKKLNESKMILILHRNPLTGDDFYGSIVKFKKEGMTLMRNSKQTVKMAVENTKFVNILRLYESHTLMLCSPEIKLGVTFKLLKKMPYYLLLGGIVDDKFVKRNKLEEYSKLTSIDAMRAELVSVLNTAPSQLVYNLSQHQMTTVSYLNQYVESQSTPNKVETTDDSDKAKTDK